MNAVIALALRRVGLVGAGLAATLAAHAVAVEGAHVAPTAPVLWGTLLLAAAMCGGRSRFRARSYGVTAALLAGLQTVLHAVLVVAPWALGLAPHHHALPVIDGRSVLVHVAVALLLALLLRRADLLLAAATRAVAAVARALAPPPPRSPRRAATRLRACVTGPRSRARHRPRSSRGPPIGPLPAGPSPTR